jgi:hypothetical protein
MDFCAVGFARHRLAECRALAIARSRVNESHNAITFVVRINLSHYGHNQILHNTGIVVKRLYAHPLPHGADHRDRLT